MSFVCLWSPSWQIGEAHADEPGARGEGRGARETRALHNPTLHDDYTSAKGKEARRKFGMRESVIATPGAAARDAVGARGEGRAARDAAAAVKVRAALQAIVERRERGPVEGTIACAESSARIDSRVRGAPPRAQDHAASRGDHHRSAAPSGRRPLDAAPSAAARDPEDAARFATLLPALLACTPRVSAASANRVWADARGLDASLLAQELLDAARRHGFDDVHAGAATTVVAAELAATRCEAPLLVVRPGTDREFVARFPVEVLEPSTLTASLLDGVGVETCGQLAALDAASVEVRLGAEGARLWRLARADDPRLVFTTPLRALPSASVEWVEYALRDPERLQFVINSLLGTVCTALAAMGERARELSLDFALANRSRFVHPLRASRPTAVQSAWMRLVRTALERLTLPDAVVGVELRVERATGNDAAQGDLFDRGFASAPAVESALAQLADDQGDVVITPRNSAHPLIDARTEWVVQPPSKVVDDEGARLKKIGSTVDPRLTLQLVTPPRRVRVTTTRRRDHRIPVRYRDQGRWWTLVDVAGPDRVSGGQWDTPYAREYFRCVREDGVMVWVYRDSGLGTRDSGATTKDPSAATPEPRASSPESRWFFHGWWD